MIAATRLLYGTAIATIIVVALIAAGVMTFAVWAALNSCRPDDDDDDDDTPDWVGITPRQRRGDEQPGGFDSGSTDQ